MKYKLTTVARYYTLNAKRRYEKVGFEFRRLDKKERSPYDKGEMYRIINTPTIDIKKVKDIQKLVEDYGEIIIDNDTLTIYDDYRE